MMKNTTASIIICTYNRASDLTQTLAALATIDVPDHLPTELIVVDNASTDNTKEVVCSCELSRMSVRYIYEPRQGQCYARNTGIASAYGKIILFTDDDVRPPVNWIEAMCMPILSGQTQAIAGSIKIACHLERTWMQPLHREWLLDFDIRNVETPHVMIGANMAFSTSVLSKVPAYDVELGPGALGFSDDVLYSWQVEKAGFTILSAGDVTVEHHFDPSRLSRTSLLNRAKQEGRVSAYLAYHFLHSQLRFSWLRQARHQTRLAAWRILNRKQYSCEEVCAEDELRLIKEVYFHKQYLIERKRPRNYEKHGLTKVRGEQYTLPSHFTQA